MRIRSIHVYRALLPVQGGEYRMASGTVRNLDSTLVAVTTEDGLTGWGETCPIGPVYQPHHTLGARAALNEIAPGMIGEPTGSIRYLAKRMDERLNGHGYAKAALDIAFLDILGRAPRRAYIDAARRRADRSGAVLLLHDRRRSGRDGADRGGEGS